MFHVKHLKPKKGVPWYHGTPYDERLYLQQVFWIQACQLRDNE